MSRHALVVGGGISGLGTAWFLSRAKAHPPDRITVLEASDRWGGILRSRRRDGFLFEGGPDSFVVAKPQAQELCRRLGLGDQLIGSPADGRGAWVWRSGQLHRFPSGILMRAPIPARTLLESSLLSPEGRRRILEEPKQPAGLAEDESVAAFVRRRLGEEVLENFADPLVAGVFGGRAEDVGVRSTFRALFELERARGFVTEAEGTAETAGKSPFVTLRDGVGSLIDALLRDLASRVDLRLATPVESIRSAGGRHAAVLAGGGEIQAEALVLAVPPPAAARLAVQWPWLAEALEGIACAPSIVVCLGFDEDVVGEPTGSGFLVPRLESRTILACTWMHRKFSHRCPPGRALLRCFIGGENARRLLECPDGEILRRVETDLAAILGMDRPADAAEVFRWRHGLPQYGVGHHLRAAAIVGGSVRQRGFCCIGNFLDGVGVSDCLRHARAAAERIEREWA